MVAAVRTGASRRAVARARDVSLSTVQWWLGRAGQFPLDRIDWADCPPIPKRRQRTQVVIEDHGLVLRRELKETSDLGEYGARAIHRELTARGAAPVPAVRTIGRILERRGALDAGRRQRRPPPPPGWYLPAVRERRAELDSFDTIEEALLEHWREFGLPAYAQFDNDTIFQGFCAASGKRLPSRRQRPLASEGVGALLP
jgi:hypothetical protein